MDGGTARKTVDASISQMTKNNASNSCCLYDGILPSGFIGQRLEDGFFPQQLSPIKSSGEGASRENDSSPTVTSETEPIDCEAGPKTMSHQMRPPYSTALLVVLSHHMLQCLMSQLPPLQNLEGSKILEMRIADRDALKMRLQYRGHCILPLPRPRQISDPVQ